MAPRQRKTGKNLTKKKSSTASDATVASDETIWEELAKEKRQQSSGRAATFGIALLVCLVAVFAGLSSIKNGPENEKSTTNESPKTTLPIDPATKEPPPQLLSQFGSYELLETVPHDENAFTQGLILTNRGDFYESTGLYGESDLRQVDIHTGEVLQRKALPKEYFAEGICYYEDDNGQGRIVQLTWKENTAFVYDSKTFQVLSNFSFTTSTGEGWGMVYRNTTSASVVVSDGSATLHLWDATTWQEQSRLQVHLRYQPDQNQSIRYVNELEWDHHSDTILANVWYQDVLIRLDPDTGFVRNIYQLKSLFPTRPESADCLNGIVTTDTANVVWVTGKKWPNMYRIRLID